MACVILGVTSKKGQQMAHLDARLQENDPPKESPMPTDPQPVSPPSEIPESPSEVPVSPKNPMPDSFPEEPEPNPFDEAFYVD